MIPALKLHLIQILIRQYIRIFLVSDVNDTADHKNDSLLIPIFFVRMLQTVCITVIDIPCKSSQRTSNFGSPCLAVSCFVVGVIDTAHYWSAVSLVQPLLVSCVIDTAHYWSAVSLTLPTTFHLCHWHCHYCSAVSLTLPTTGQLCHWHCPLLVSCVIDTAHHRPAVSLTDRVVWGLKQS
jgi:hypothetical protein